MTDSDTTVPTNFIRQIIDTDLANGKNDGKVKTRFPPEPNGFLHIGHAKAICVSFGIADDYQGSCNLRFDDTNPAKEEARYAESIKKDVEWLGFEWDELLHTSDYFQQLFDYAVILIEQGNAYVDSLTADQIREHRGSLTESGKNSPYRDRSVEENLDLFQRMKSGEFADGEYLLRAKIDMSSPNINMRDPAVFRIRHIEHHNTGSDWCIYPMYDYAHCMSDMLEGITHSLCSLEFEDHRPLYDWFLDNLPVPCHPQQIEFSRLNLEHTVMSKRKLNQLVIDETVDGWDDPRMPTLSGMRRRGYTPESVRDFISRVGVTKKNNTVEMSLLESCIREDLGQRCARVMAVIDPIKVILTNYPEDKVEMMDAPFHPQKPELGQRELPFSREIYIDSSDFKEDANRKYFRLKSGGSVRLRYGYIIDFQQVIKDNEDNIVELHCTYDPETKSGQDKSGRKVKGVIHWLSAEQAKPAVVRMYDRLFTEATPDVGHGDIPFTDFINFDSCEIFDKALVEPSLADCEPGSLFQFERQGYFAADSVDHKPTEKLVFNRTVALRDTWAKVQVR
ncbi:MAG: glutamine--tRNA ligase/YqeY domain fusion protein [Gammaproteobacteria bacterium]|nr:glutamine--tRNA ligase/YqeY domain fusion protein [Gammaproteobacteria bacterium]